MPALISNYSMPEISAKIPVAIVFQERETALFNSCITISRPNFYGLNGRINKLLNDCSNLTDNWDNDGALAPVEGVIQRAKYVTSLLENHGQPIFHAAPGPNGEIMLDIRNRNKTRSLEILIYKSRSVCVQFPEYGEPVQGVFQEGDLPDLLSWLNKK